MKTLLIVHIYDIYADRVFGERYIFGPMEKAASMYYSSSLGRIRITYSVMGLSALAFTDAKPETNSEISNELTKQLDDYFSGKRISFDIAFDISGTDFQQKIWQELGRIPFGEKITYAELARRSGDIKAVRAVAHAIALNPLAIVIPCHRVIGSDGNLRGYAWGLARKQWLLDHEAAASGKSMKLF